jgi:hypothetical protein
MTGEKIDRTVFVETMKMRVRIQQLNDKEFKLSGTPSGPDGQPGPEDEVVSDMTALEDIYCALGLMDNNMVTGALQRFFRPVWRALEHPTTRGWTRIRTVNEWKR